MTLTESVLVESRSARDNQLANVPHERALEVMNKAKAIIMAVWQGFGAATTGQMAEFYEVPVDAIESALRRSRSEFEADGLKTIKGRQLKDFRHVSALEAETSKAPSSTVWTPRAALRLGMLLRDSEVAKVVRTCMLDMVEHVIPAKDAEIERMKLELQLLRAKQRYQDSGQSIITTTSMATLAYVRGDGPPPTQFVHTEKFIDAATGKEIGSSTGRSLTQLITDAGLNPKSTRDRQRIKKILKSSGFDYDRMQNWSAAAYLREYPVLENAAYDQALNAVLTEVFSPSGEQNLFVYEASQSLAVQDS